MLALLQQRLAALNPAFDFVSLRYMAQVTEQLSVRQGVAEPLRRARDAGVMLTVVHAGGHGYAATSDLSLAGLQAALQHAASWAELSSRHGLFDYRKLNLPHPKGDYLGAGVGELGEWDRRELLDLLHAECAQAQADSRIVDCAASLQRSEVEQIYITLGGGSVQQRFVSVVPAFSATAFADGEVQIRSLGSPGHGTCRQGGMNLLSALQLQGAGQRVADEALQLLVAPNCPSGVRDLLLMPEQMMLQIHESIGHPLELDRILGDERNYAGTSFVSLDMFGSYQYGSPLLNISYDPTRLGEYASFAFDDDGMAAQKQFLIKDGILQAPLGGEISQARALAAGAQLGAVANSRACSWNRPAIDRMANLNLEVGEQNLAQLIKGIEHGVLMDANVSWSIDDSRNKFQFGCEWGQLIENGELKGVVKNPNYRGISATFWRSLKAVGDASTDRLMGTPFCGKGEPNQCVKVGHASPACVFADIEVFGGEA